MILCNTIQLLPDNTNCCKTVISILNGRSHFSVLRYGPDDMISATFCINWKKMILINSVTMYIQINVPYN